jgi:hypothetical protein
MQNSNGLIIRLLLITAFLSGALLLLNAIVEAHIENGSQAVGTLCAVAVFLIPGAYKGWKESPGSFRLWVLCASVVVITASAVPLGLRIEKTQERSKRIKAIMAQGRDLGPRNAELRKSLAEVTSKKATGFLDFYAQTAQIKMLLDQNETTFERESKLLTQLGNEFSDDPKASAWISSIKRVLASDMRMFGALKEEAACARELANSTEAEQHQFVQVCISPQQQILESADREEEEALLSLKSAGVTLPPEVLRILSGH